MISFSGDRLEARHWRTFENVVGMESVESTNDLARELIELYFDEDQFLAPLVLVAKAQSKARGRRGEWRAPAGRGLYFTIVRPVLPDEPLSLVPIAVARWTREALKEATGVAVELKWPNDLYVGRRKLAGILAESRTQGEQTYIAVGIGLNVLGLGQEFGVPNATTLEEESGRAFPLGPLLQTLLDRFDAELAAPRWDAEVHGWEKASLHHPGDRLRVRRNGRELTGEYLGLSPEGFLRLKTASGEKVLANGELAEW